MISRERLNALLPFRTSGGHIVMGLGVILALAAMVLVVRFVVSRTPQGAPTALTESPVQTAEKNIVDSLDRERRSLNRIKLQAATSNVQEVQAQLNGLKHELSVWDSEVRSLLTSESGRRLAADQALVEQFTASFRKEGLWTAAQIEGAEARLKLLLDPVEQAVKEDSGDYAPSSDWSAQVDRELQTLAAAAKAYQDTRRTILAVLRDAPHAPAEITLQDAMSQMDERLARERAVAIETAVREEHRRKTEDLTKAETERVRTAADQEVAQVEAARLRALAEDPAVQAKYQPFLSKGRFRFNHAKNLPANPDYYLYIDGPTEPPSYNALVTIGVTRDLKTFVGAGVGYKYFRGPHTDGARYFHRNDRPLWTTGYPKTDAQWAEYQKLFEDFQQLAPVWRDMGLLKP